MSTLRSADPLVLDFVEWIARQPRPYSEVVETWRTSCPRLTIWEDAADAGYVAREAVAGGTIVAVTEAGEQLLRDDGRIA
jgi:CTP-dependent riboflavin kinase